MTKHKHLLLDQHKLDRARRFFGAKTESEAVEQALDFAIAEQSILDTLDQLGGKGFDYADVLAPDAVWTTHEPAPSEAKPRKRAARAPGTGTAKAPTRTPNKEGKPPRQPRSRGR